MIKVKINNGTHGSVFETIQDANLWIAEQESTKKPWGYSKTPKGYSVEVIDLENDSHQDAVEYRAKKNAETQKANLILNFKAKQSGFTIDEIVAVIKEII